MSDSEWWVHACRVYVVVVASLVAIIGTAQVGRWRTYMVQNQLAWLAVAAFNFSAWYGCLDQLTKGAEGGPRTYIVALATTWALYAVCHQPVRDLLRWWCTRRLIARYDVSKRGKL